MIRFAVINDIHIADNPPLGRRDTYCAEIYAKLDGIADYCDAASVDLVVLTGDVFHAKRANRTSHELVQNLMELFAHSFPCPVIGVAGNHDVSEHIHRQPLGVLARAGAIELLWPDDPYTFSPKHGLFNHGQEIVFIGRPYSTDMDLNPDYYRLTDDEKEAVEFGDRLSIMVAHGSVVPNGAAPVYPHLRVGQIDFGGPVDIFLAGHLHECWGIHDMPDGGVYANLGSLGRVSRSHENMNSELARSFLVVTIPDEGEVHFDPVPIPNMLPPEEVFLKTEIADSSDDALAKFAEHLSTGLVIEEQPIEQVLASLGKNVPEKVKARVRSYLEAAGL